MNASWSGASTVAAGALITTCWPRNEKPIGALAVTPPTAIPTLPPSGTVTAAVTGALAVGRRLPGSVVTVPCPAGRTWATVVGDGGEGPRGHRLDAIEGSPVPEAFVAVTVKVYVASSTMLPRFAVVLPLTDTVTPDGLAVTVYPVIGLPPSEAGATQLIEAVPDRQQR